MVMKKIKRIQKKIHSYLDFNDESTLIILIGDFSLSLKWGFQDNLIKLMHKKL